MAVNTGFNWLTPLIVKIINGTTDVTMRYDQIAWIVAIVEVAEFITPMPAGFLVNRWGRKPWLLSCGLLMVAAWAVVAWVPTMLGLYCFRVLVGFAIGIVLTVNPMYVAEIVEPNLRGSLCGHIKTLANLGSLYVYAVGPFFSYTNYAYISSIPSFLYLMTFAFAPESPYFLLLKGRREEASQVLCWLRDKEDVTEELSAIETAVHTEMKQGRFSDLYKDKRARKNLFIVSTVCLVNYFGGTSTIANYSTHMLAGTKSIVSGDVVTICMGVVFTVTALVSTRLSDSVGRKPLVVVSSLGMGLFSLAMSAFLYLQSECVWILYLSLMAYTIVANMGLSHALFTLQGEYFSTDTRGPAGGIITCLSTFFVFVSLKLYQVIEESIGVYFNFIVFAAACFFGCIVAAIWMDETANKSLSDIQQVKKN